MGRFDPTLPFSPYPFMRNVLTIIILLFTFAGSLSAQSADSIANARRNQFMQNRDARIKEAMERSSKRRDSLKAARMQQISQERENALKEHRERMRNLSGDQLPEKSSSSKREHEGHVSKGRDARKDELKDRRDAHPYNVARQQSAYKPSFLPRTLYFNPNIETFVRDAEYFLPYTKGYTALGFFLNPTFTYVHDSKISASVGLHMVGIAGDHDKIRDLSPIVTLEYKPIPNVRIVGGTLDKTIFDHGMGEPMFDYDRKFYAPKEDGLQIFVDTKVWYTEMWCNWEDFIVVDSPWQEKFTFGWHNLLRFNLDKKSRNVLSIPLDLMMNHRGGQIDAVQDTCIETLANFSAGLRYDCKIGRRSNLQIALPYYGFSNRSNEEHIHTHFKEGWGLYPQLSWDVRMFGKKSRSTHALVGKFGYWYGDGFVSGRGSYLFQSRSYFDEGFTCRYRHMLTPSLAYDLSNTLGVLLQAYCDLDESKTDFAATISLKFGNDFKLHSWNR